MARRTASNPNQLGFAFDAPVAATSPAELAGLEQRISVIVSEALKGDPRPREIIAAEATVLLGDDEVSKAMLDAYASKARPDHKVVASRLFAIIAVTKRYDLLDRVLREIGAALLVGEEINLARIGQLDRQIALLEAERDRVRQAAPLLKGD